MTEFSFQVAEADLLKLATKEYDKQREMERQQTIFDRIMAYTSQNYNKETNKFQPPINAYVGDYGQNQEMLRSLVCNS